MKRILLIFLCFGVKAEASVSADEIRQWSASIEWQNLLHMQKTWKGEESKIRGGTFFLASDGASNSQAELTMTFQKMFDSEPSVRAETQCRFLARRDFILARKPDLKAAMVPCRFSDDWLAKLNATKISLIFATGYMNSAASSFGHTFLKLQNPDHQQGRELLDYGINFAARTADTEGALYALYGLFGYFPGNFSMLPYHQMIQDYTNLEGRDLWEYELNFSPDEVRRVLYHLLELEGSTVDYYFLDDNCSFMILKALEIGRPGLRLLEADETFVIPLDTLKRARALISSSRYRPSLQAEWRQRRNQLSPTSQKQVVDLNAEASSEKVHALESAALDAATFRVALKSFENRERWKNLNYELQKERALRGPQAPSFAIRKPEISPEESPDSSSIEVGFSEFDENQAAMFGIRAAFRDQLSSNVGVPPFSHLEVLSFQWRIPTTSSWIPWRYRLLDSLSTQAVDRFESPLSWGVSVGGQSRDASSMQNEALGRLGYSFDFWRDKIRLSGLAVFGTAQDPSQSFQAVVGVDFRFWILWTNHIRSLAQYEWLTYPSFQTSRAQMDLALDLNKQLELRVGWTSFHRGENLQIEKRLTLMQSFLF